MPRGYRVFNARRFPSRDDYVFAAQSNFVGLEVPASTMERVLPDVPGDYEAYLVHHEMVVEQVGRAQSVEFTQFLAPFEFNVYVRRGDDAMFVQTNKRVCASFVSDLSLTGDFDLSGNAVDFDRLMPIVADVKGAWFRFRQSDLHAGAYFGSHVDRSLAYQEAMLSGVMSSLYVLHEFNGQQIQIQVTADCCIVIFPDLHDVRSDLAVVESVLSMLRSVGAVQEIQFKRGGSRRSSARGGGRILSSLGQLYETVEESGQ